jgi:hypothetical protein
MGRDMTWLGRIFHKDCERQTSRGRAAIGLAVGSLAGTALTTLCWGVAALAADTTSPAGFVIALVMFPFTLIVWTAGLFLLAPAGWWALHRLGARCQQAAMIYGGGLTSVVLVAIYATGSLGNPDRWFVPTITFIGVVVGWVVGKVAYEPAQQS